MWLINIMYYNDSSHSAVDLSDGLVLFALIFLFYFRLFINFNERLGQLSSELRDVGVRLRRHLQVFIWICTTTLLLQFFFMNPLDKYRIRRQFPFKLVLQILKAIFVTTQVILYFCISKNVLSWCFSLSSEFPMLIF